jgi:NAD(P)-dependent dehydrogenase (short-subunit alcohol dehydrogenase family)
MTWGPFDLTGRAVVVTGGARGIGFGCARRFREAGAHVLIADIDAEAASSAADQLGEHPGIGGVAARAVDVADPDDARAAVRGCVESFGTIDVLVNNAGVYPAASFEEMTPEHIRGVLRVNVEGVILMTQEAGLQMTEQGTGGSIVNLASIGALRGLHPGLLTYGASKGAVISFTRRAAGALGPHAIRVNAIAPGTIHTETAQSFRDAGATVDEELLRSSEARVPLGRAGTPDDIATVAVFLASDAARYVTGVTMVVDGGAMLV